MDSLITFSKEFLESFLGVRLLEDFLRFPWKFLALQVYSYEDRLKAGSDETWYFVDSLWTTLAIQLGYMCVLDGLFVPKWILKVLIGN